MMKKSKSGSLIKKLMLVVGASGILVVLMWGAFVFAQGWLDSQQKAPSADVSAADESEEVPVLSVNETSVEIGKGLSFQLTATGGQQIVYSSSDEQIAVVDENGLIRGTGIGACTVTAQNEYGSKADCAVNVRKVCYLTIDDGPTENTEKILALLKEYDVKATFFVVSSHYLNLIKNMREQGCAVGLHSYSHIFKRCYASAHSYFYGIDMLADTVEKYTGERCVLLRFPGGTTTSRCDPLWMRRNLNGAEDLGYRVFDWTATTGDTSPHASADFSVKNVKKTCTEDVEILLMHDRSLNLSALKKFIPYLREQGYIFETLDNYPEKSYHFKPKYSRKHPDLPSKSVKVTHETFSIFAGNEILLVAKMNPLDSTDFVRWESSDPSIASVNSVGHVKALKPGKADIYAITSSGQRSVCHMTVK